VYCTTWTFYGSIGSAANSGYLFLAIYIGPSLALLMVPGVQKQIFKLKEKYHITSIADLVSLRYGKSGSLAAIVTVVAMTCIVPYVGLQIKAVTGSFDIITRTGYGYINQNLDIILVCILIVFTIITGARRLDATTRHPGIIAAISVDAVVKLVVFIMAGISIIHFIGGGFGNVVREFSASDAATRMNSIMQTPGYYIQWMTYLVLSMSAILFLPRQFHVSVVENSNPRHFKTAMWFFPLYLLLINLLVLPVAMVGLVEGYDPSMADLFLLLLPGDAGMYWLELLVFIGGFSAAISMIMISTLAMSIMITNHLVMPVLNMTGGFEVLKRRLLPIRWLVVGLFIYMGYLFAGLVSQAHMLIDLGIVSFAGIFQFVPAIIGGIFWKRASKTGARAGIIVGFAGWIYMLLLPTLAESGMISMSLVAEGPFGLELLKPKAFLGLESLGKIPHAVFWSTFLNSLVFALCSLISRDDSTENMDLPGIGLHENMHTEYTHASAPACLLVDMDEKRPLLVQLLSSYYSTYEAEEYVKNTLDSFNMNRRKLVSVEEFANVCAKMESILAGSIGLASAHRVFSDTVLYTGEELEELSRYYGEVIASLRLSPDDLKRRIDYYRERDILLSNFADDLSAKIDELQHEIEQRVYAEEKMRSSLAEKEVLLKEIHHRVKNNMQIITSLLGLQMRNMDDSGDRELFKESQERIYAMALVHEKLYHSDNLAYIDFKEYITGLISEYRKSYDNKTRKVTFNVQVEDVELGIDEAIPCGLIINELITNSLKHAFRDDENGRIDVLFQKTGDDQYMLKIVDNGGGFPEKVFYEDSASMGFQLVRALLSQLNASIRVDGTNGGMFTIYIPV